MSDFAILDSNARVLRVEHGDEAPTDLEEGATAAEVSGWAGWPDAPGDGQVLAYRTGAFAWDDPRTLAQAQAAQWETVKAARGASIAAGFTWSGSKFDSDDESQQRIQGAVQLAVLAAGAGQTFSIDWTLFDNTTRTLSGADMVAVGIALGAFVQSAFAAGVALRDQINAATSLDAVRSLNWAA